MNNALVHADAIPTVTSDQLELIKKTIAQGATADELKLYLYDCARQGVHPLDKLIHFTKRKGKYVPITSIDFMRIRAAETGEYAGSDAALYLEDNTWTSAPKKQEPPPAAMVTVWRLVQGQRCKFEAVARWAEYKPDEDFMWRKMPHTMLAKCAEASALRKGFPKQLAGLYAKEEMDQAGSGTTQPLTVGARNSDGTPPIRARIVDVKEEIKPGKKSGEMYTKTTVTLSTGQVVTTLDPAYRQTIKDCLEDGSELDLTTKETRWGTEITEIARLQPDGAV